MTPLFLVGLAALAIPVLLHLIQRERKNVVQFPSLMFLRQIPYQSVRRRRIRDWLLLLHAAGGAGADRDGVRAAVLPARPRFAAGAPGAREAVDPRRPSYSMGYGDRWPRALAAARNAIDGLGAGRSRLAGPLLARAPKWRCARTGSRPAAWRRVPAAAGRGRDALRAGAEARGQHPRRVGAAAARSDPHQRLPAPRLAGRRRREAAGWRRADAGHVADSGKLEPVGHAGVAAAVAVREPGARDGHRRRRQSRAKRRATVEVTLELGGRAIQSRRRRRRGQRVRSVTFEPVTVAVRNMRATVKLPDDALKRDNVFHFVVSPSEPVQRRHRRACRRRAEQRSTCRARSPSARRRASSCKIRQADSLSTPTPRQAGVVILNDVQVARRRPIGWRVRRARRRAVLSPRRARRPGRRWPTSCRRCPGEPVDRTRRTPSRLGGARVQPSGVRAVPRAAQRRLSRRRASMATAASRQPRTAGRWRGSTTARRRCWSGRVGAGRVLMWTLDARPRGTTWRSNRCSCRSSTASSKYLGGYREPPVADGR